MATAARPPAGLAVLRDAQLHRLMAWLAPGYPVGAYSYSHGLEWAVEAGLVRSRGALIAWLADLARHGAGWSDAVLFAAAWRAVEQRNGARFRELAELAQALAPTAELHLETMAQGQAFARITLAAWADDDGRLADFIDAEVAVAYPLAVAAACAVHEIALDAGLAAYLHGFTANLVSAAVRLVPLGQTDGQLAMAALLPTLCEMATLAAATDVDELGTAALMADWCSMRHETQYARLFRS